MGRSRAGGRHLDAATTLDYLEERLSPARRRQVEEHLGGPCPKCRERLREFGMLIETMRSDRTPEVPAELRRSAASLFPQVAEGRPTRRPILGIARLLFDSWATPLPAAARHTVGEVRRLRFAAGDGVLEIECERMERGTWSVTGRLDVPDASVWTVELESLTERMSAHPDADGGFAFDRVPAGSLRLRIHGPGTRYQIAGITL